MRGLARSARRAAVIAAETPAEDARSDAGEPAAAAPEIEREANGIPILRFPRGIRLHGRYEGYTGAVRSVDFVNGVSSFLAGFSEIMHVTACTGAVEHLATGLTLVPQYENREFVIDPATRFWNRL